MNEKITMEVTCANYGSLFKAGYERPNSDSNCSARGLVQMHIHLTIEDHVVFDASKADFADCLFERSALGAECVETMTFDARAAKHAGTIFIY